MIINRILDEVLSTYSNIAVLRALHSSSTGLTGREISRNALISPKSALMALSRLTDLKIVNRVIGGRDHIFTLNRKNYLVIYGLLPLLKAENNFMPQIVKELKKHLSKKCISIIVFGSVARGDETVESDFDICIITTTEKQLKELSIIKERVFLILAEKFGVTLGLTVFTEKQFKNKGKKEKPPINNIVKEGIVLHGKSIRAILRD